MAQDLVFDPAAFSRRDLEALRRHHDRLADLARAETATAGDASRMTLRVCFDDEEVELPASLARALAAALAEVADGHALHLAPLDDELTTSEAAEVLGVSRPFVVKLLEEGIMPHRKVGTHRRVRRADVLAYKARMRQEAEDALQALADEAQDHGLGYD